MRKLLILPIVLVAASLYAAGSVCPSTTPDTKDTIVQDSSKVCIPILRDSLDNNNSTK